ncbi:MAG: NYN domain-containing protein [Bacteroidetes bacterium]|nr:NYN domain-containing protein [Bacteroidota bacterium]
MYKPLENYAFIDGQNLNLGIKSLGWKIDLKKFRKYLAEKYGIKKAYYFIGYLPEMSDLYTSLQDYGYVLIFKPTLRTNSGLVKGNCDAELVLQAMIDIQKYEKAILVTGDGDFSCLAKYLLQQNKLERILSPSQKNCSHLLIKAAKGNIGHMADLRTKLEYNEK